MTRKLLGIIVLSIFIPACGMFQSEQKAFVPIQETAQKQYAYAVSFRSKNELYLRDFKDMPRMMNTRETVRQTFAKVVEYFPADREVTPLARLDLAEMKGMLDVPKVAPSKRQLKAAVKELQALRTEFPEFEYIQAKSRFDEAVCLKNLGQFEKAQGLFKDVSESYKDNKDKSIRSLAGMAQFQYQQTYVR